MKELPLVTICMPTYNHEPYIEAAILSVISQEYSNIKLIISDDCSTDNTYNIVSAYEEKYPDLIHAQRHDKNLGIMQNVKSIYPLITGKYVCWFSGDDLFYPEKIKNQVYLMESNPNCIFSFHATDVISNVSKFLYEFNDPSLGAKLHLHNISNNLLDNRCFICAISVMINRNLAANIQHVENAGACSDWLMLFELSNRGSVLYMPETLASYRRHANNISKSLSITNEESIYHYVLNNYPNYKRSVYKGLSQLYCMYIFKYLLAKNFTMSLYCCKKLLQVAVISPSNIPALFMKVCSELVKRLKLLVITGNVIR